MEHSGDHRSAKRVQLFRPSQRKVLERRLHDLPAQTTHILRAQRHPTQHHDVSAAVVNLLLHACAEGTYVTSYTIVHCTHRIS